MRNKEFFDGNHANSYLSSCVIRIKDEPIYIRDVEPTETKGVFSLRYRRLGSTKHEFIKTDSKNINMVPVPLGMLSVYEASAKSGYETCMIYRIPVRRWKVGLCAENLASRRVNSKTGEGVVSADVLVSEELRRTIMGVYPSLREAIKLTDNTGKCVGINRSFAICGRNLYYKEIGIPVGAINDRLELTLFDKFLFIKQELEQDKL